MRIIDNAMGVTGRIAALTTAVEASTRFAGQQKDGPTMFFDPMYFVFMLPGLLFMLWAQHRVKSTYQKFSKVQNDARLTGAQTARRMLDNAGLQNVAIEPVRGELSDHYDPRSRILRLSEGVYGVPSVAAIRSFSPRSEAF